jgi:hypothetical protein
MIQRRHHNKIDSIKDNHGKLLKNHANIEKEIVHFFKYLLSEPQLDRRLASKKLLVTSPNLSHKRRMSP